jgi:hypothetical protein
VTGHFVDRAWQYNASGSWGTDPGHAEVVLDLTEPGSPDRLYFFPPLDIEKLLCDGGCKEIATRRYTSVGDIEVWSDNGAIGEVSEHFLWESIDRWINTHQTTPRAHREIFNLFAEAPQEERDVRPFEISPSGAIRDRWRWCVCSVRKHA